MNIVQLKVHKNNLVKTGLILYGSVFKSKRYTDSILKTAIFFQSFVKWKKKKKHLKRKQCESCNKGLL